MTARGCEKTGTVPSVARANPLLAALTSGAPWTVPSFFTAPNGAVQTRPSHPAPKAAFSRGVRSSQADACGSEFGCGALAALGGFLCEVGACTASFGRGSAWGWSLRSTGFRSMTGFSVGGSSRRLGKAPELKGPDSFVRCCTRRRTPGLVDTKARERAWRVRQAGDGFAARRRSMSCGWSTQPHGCGSEFGWGGL